jgi:hypothetical protein
MVKSKPKTQRSISSKTVTSTIKRTIKDYRKTLRALASAPGRRKKG